MQKVSFLLLMLTLLLVTACQTGDTSSNQNKPSFATAADANAGFPEILDESEVSGIDVRMCGYVTLDRYLCVEPNMPKPVGRVWLRFLSDKPVLNGKLHAVLYEVLGDQRNQLAEHTFDVDSDRRFRTYMEFTNPGTFVVTLGDPEKGVLGEVTAQIIDTTQAVQ